MFHVMSKILLTTAAVSFIFTGVANAVCTVPSGDYAGSGAGPYSLAVQMPDPSKPGSLTTITANGTGSTVASFKFTFSGQKLSGKFNAQSKIGGLKYSDGSIYTNLQDIRGGTVSPSDVLNALPASRSAVNYFDKSTCTGIITLSGDVFVAQINFNGTNATRLPNFVGPTGNAPSGWTMSSLWKISVSNNGSNISLTDYTNMSGNNGAVLILEKQ